MPPRRAKRALDLYDSPQSSTPPRPLKKQNVAYASSSSMMTPSDSPTNPFRSTRSSRVLPRPTPKAEHIVLRAQLVTADEGSVHRIVSVPANYTFLHLHRLMLFLFGWSDEGKKDVSRRTRIKDHQFNVQKDVVMHHAAHRQGMVKSGRTWVLLGTLQNTKRSKVFSESTWEREQAFALQNAWPRGPDENRAITYTHDKGGHYPRTVHLTCHTGKLPARSGVSNTPYVFSGQGLPDDDDDDFFPIDLEQWNEDRAFEDFISDESRGGLIFEDDEDEWSPEERIRRINESHARLKQLTSDGLSDMDWDNHRAKKNEKDQLVQEVEDDEDDDCYEDAPPGYHETEF